MTCGEPVIDPVQHPFHPHTFIHLTLGLGSFLSTKILPPGATGLQGNSSPLSRHST